MKNNYVHFCLNFIGAFIILSLDNNFADGIGLCFIVYSRVLSVKKMF